MRAFGADARGHREPGGHHAAPDPVDDASAPRAIVAEVGGYPTDQFNNPDMLDGYRGLGRGARSTQLDGRARRLCRLRRHRRLLPRRRRARSGPAAPACAASAVEPARVGRARPAARRRTHRIEGGGSGFVPPQLDPTTSTTSSPSRATRRSRWPAARPARRALVGPVDRREPRRGAAGGPRARAGAPGRDGLVDSGLKYLGGRSTAGRPELRRGGRRRSRRRPRRARCAARRARSGRRPARRPRSPAG